MELFVAIFVIFLLFLYNYYYYVKDAEFVAKINKIPGPKSYPIIGCGLMYITHRHDISDFVLYKLPKLYGPYMRAWIFGKAQVLISSARGVEPILKNPVFNIKSENYNLVREYMGEYGLVPSTDPTWRIHRKLLTPSFNVGILQDYIPIFVKNANKFCHNLAEAGSGNQIFDIMPVAGLCALDIIAETSMGVEINVQNKENLEFGEGIDALTRMMAERYLNPLFHIKLIYGLSSTKRKFDKILKYVLDFNKKVIADRRKILLENKKLNEVTPSSNTQRVEGMKIRRSLLDVMLTAENEGIVTEQEVIDEVSNFIGAGSDTVSNSVSFALYLIGTYPQVQERVLSELEEVFGDSGRVPDMVDLAKLHFLERCIKEALRIYPAIYIFERYINQDVQCEQYLIPKGCTVTITPYAIHRDPEFWPDPEKFDPDRFLPENCKGRHPYAYIPFSAGHRNCIGYKFAMIEEKVLISTVLRRFRVEATQPRESLKFELTISMRPIDGLKMKIFERNDKPKLRVKA